jgi:nitrate reductase gamma subunit
MYEFVTGPLVWLSFAIFFVGLIRWRNNPWFTLWVFLMHIGLLLTPVFLLGHSVLMRERLGFGLWSLPEGLADVLTILVIVAAIFLVLRRIALPEVRLITTLYDYLLLLIAVAPFVTGYIAAHGTPNYSFWIIAHVLCGEILLVAVPVTKLSHFVLFFLSRAQLGMDYGIKRGGMKNRGIAW